MTSVARPASKQRPLGDDQVADRHQNDRGHGQRRFFRCVDRGKARQNERQQERRRRQGESQHDRRIRERSAHAPNCFVLVAQIVVGPLKQLGHHAGLFAGGDQGDKQSRKRA